MRIIRTEMYFEESNIVGFEMHSRRRSAELDYASPGLSFAWIKAESPGPFNIGNYKWFHGSELSNSDVGRALDHLLRGGSGGRFEFEFLQKQYEIQNQSYVDFILEQPIIIEQSPPKAVPFKDLLHKSNGPLMIGTYVGYSIAGDHPALLFVTVPGGIIIVSTAWGVAEAIATGLNKRLKKLLDGK